MELGTSSSGGSRLRLAVVDDDPAIRQLLQRTLEPAHMALQTFASGEEFFEAGGASGFDVVVTDMQMERASGMEVLRACRSEASAPEVLLITGHATIRTAVEAMRMGAFDYLTKPLDPEELLRRVGQAADLRRAKLQASALEREVERRGAADPIAESPAMRHLLRQAGKAAASNATVLLVGETGSGKDVVARYIQTRSPRAGKTYLTVNCASLAEDFLESEIFGHAGGALPDARSKRGLFEEANGGTLLLDEIGALSLRAQMKLLEILAEGAVRRIGENHPRELDVRILATTNRDLRRMVAEGLFREDLFFRVSVVTLRVPPLRERPEDIEPLARRFASEASRRIGRMRVLAPETLELFRKHPFPGNVRELRHAIEQAVVLSEDGVLRPSELNLSSRSAVLPRPAGKGGALEPPPPRLRVTPDLLRSVLREHGGNRARAARALGISRSTLYRLLGGGSSEPAGFR